MCIRTDSIGNCQFPCGNKIAWKNVNALLNENIDSNETVPTTESVVIPPYFTNFCTCFVSFL